MEQLVEIFGWGSPIGTGAFLVLSGAFLVLLANFLHKLAIIDREEKKTKK